MIAGFDRTGIIACAHCAFIATHQNSVAVYCREQDAETGAKVFIDLTVGGPERPGAKYGESGVPACVVARNIELVGNPSPRRHGLTVTLWCEACGRDTLLHVFQHKGTTRVEVEAGS